MRNRMMKISAMALFLIFLPLIPIEVMFGYSGNIFSRIKQNFQIIMFAASL